MELIIILLIAVEVVIVSRLITSGNVSELMTQQCLIRDGPELWEMAFGAKPKTKDSEPNDKSTTH